MEVVVSSEQIRRIGFNILDKIYGPMTKHYGRFVNDVYVDSNEIPRMGVHRPLYFDTIVFIRKEDFQTFRSVIPVDELEFAQIFSAWLSRNYDVSGIKKLTTISPEKLTYGGQIQPNQSMN